MFVVWSSQMRGTAEDVPEAASLMPDPRAAHFWDGARRVGTLYQTLELGDERLRGSEPMWDVGLLFGPEARRERSADPPRPAWWERLLHFLPEERRLDPARFAEKAAQLVASGSSANQHRTDRTRVADRFRVPSVPRNQAAAGWGGGPAGAEPARASSLPWASATG